MNMSFDNFKYMCPWSLTIVFNLHMVGNRCAKTWIIPTQCFYRFFADFVWSVGKIKWFLHLDKNIYVWILDMLEIQSAIKDSTNNNELYTKLQTQVLLCPNIHTFKYS